MTQFKFGFQINGYKISTFYWDNLLIVRNIGVIAIFVATTSFGRPQELIIITVLLFLGPWLLLHLYVLPYTDYQLNRLEGMSIIILMLYCIVELVQTAYAHYNWAHYEKSNSVTSVSFLITFFIFPTFLFYYEGIRYLREQIIDISFYKSHRLFRFISCGCRSLEKYAQTKIVAENVVKHHLKNTI